MNENLDLEPKILTFACNWCLSGGADVTSTGSTQYPPDVGLIRVMCSGRVTPAMLLHAFVFGADGLLFLGCRVGECHYISGNKKAQEVCETTKKLMDALGLDSRRLRQELVSSEEVERLASIVTEFTDEMKSLGPNPMSKVESKAQ